jgi:hypothetical protein
MTVDYVGEPGLAAGAAFLSSPDMIISNMPISEYEMLNLDISPIIPKH